MWWMIAAGANGVVALAYLAIALAIWRGLRTSGQVLGNPLGLATAGIFFTCAVHHGSHTVHLLLPSEAMPGHPGPALRMAFDNPGSAAWDVLTAVVGGWYWTLRGRFPALVRGAAVFEDLRLREATERSLRASEERYRRILETTDEGVLVADAGGTVTFANSRIGELLGRPVPDLLGQPVADLAAVGDPTQLAGLLLGDRPGDRAQQELQLRRADGARLWVRASATPLRDDRGEVVGSLAMLSDVTEQRRLEHQIRQAQKLDAVGQLASGVAHDFNNLLTVIHGYAALLMSRLDESGPDRRDAEQILAAAGRAATLTRQLLAFSRDQHVELRPLELTDVVAELRQLLDRLIPATIELVLEPAGEPALVEADRGRIEQVLVNLVVNARDAMPVGGRLTIGTALADGVDAGPGRSVLLTVSDTGTGMSPEVKARVLEPFFTTKEPGKGTGLGLSTVYGIVQQFGGELAIFSEPGVGTTVKVQLPEVASAAALAGAGADPAPVAEPAGGAGTETVLLAEDDEAVRALAVRILTGVGYTVLPAADGRAALAVLADRPDVDLLITDVVMPGLTGSQLVARIAELGIRLPVLFTSAYTRGLITYQGLLDPAVAYLEKPFSAAALTGKVRAILDADADTCRQQPRVHR